MDAQAEAQQMDQGNRDEDDQPIGPFKRVGFHESSERSLWISRAAIREDERGVARLFRIKAKEFNWALRTWSESRILFVSSTKRAAVAFSCNNSGTAGLSANKLTNPT